MKKLSLIILLLTSIFFIGNAQNTEFDISPVTGEYSYKGIVEINNVPLPMLKTLIEENLKEIMSLSDMILISISYNRNDSIFNIKCKTKNTTFNAQTMDPGSWEPLVGYGSVDLTLYFNNNQISYIFNNLRVNTKRTYDQKEEPIKSVLFNSDTIPYEHINRSFYIDAIYKIKIMTVHNIPLIDKNLKDFILNIVENYNNSQYDQYKSINNSFYNKKYQETFQTALKNSGYQLKSGSACVLGGFSLDIIGGALIIAGSTNSTAPALLYVGGGLSVVGLILKIVGFSKINKSGKFLIDASKVTYKF